MRFAGHLCSLTHNETLSSRPLKPDFATEMVARDCCRHSILLFNRRNWKPTFSALGKGEALRNEVHLESFKRAKMARNAAAFR